MDEQIKKQIDYLVSEGLDSKVKILGLTMLLMQKGIITEDEIESSYATGYETFTRLAKEMKNNENEE